MRSRAMESVSWVALTLVALAPACAPVGAPSWHGKPVVSAEGVQVGVPRQTCTQNVDPDFAGEDLVEATLEIEVRNATRDAVLVRRDQFRLVAPDGTAVKPLTWRSADPLTIAAGAEAAFELRFMNRGGLGCGAELALDAGAGVVVGQAPIHLAALRFVPHPPL